jgi:hypothetical protein
MTPYGALAGIVVEPTAGYLTLIVPPVSPMPDGALMPPSPYLIGAKDTATGQLRCGVLGVHLHSTIAKDQIEIHVYLDEIAQPDGAPAVTPEQVGEVLRRVGHDAARWPEGVPTVRSRFRVDGFELGEQRSPFFDPERFWRDVGDVKRALELDDPEADGDETA